MQCCYAELILIYFQLSRLTLLRGIQRNTSTSTDHDDHLKVLVSWPSSSGFEVSLAHHYHHHHHHHHDFYPPTHHSFTLPSSSQISSSSSCRNNDWKSVHFTTPWVPGASPRGGEPFRTSLFKQLICSARGQDPKHQLVFRVSPSWNWYAWFLFRTPVMEIVFNFLKQFFCFSQRKGKTKTPILWFSSCLQILKTTQIRLGLNLINHPARTFQPKTQTHS